MSPRLLLLGLYRSALAAVEPRSLVRDCFLSGKLGPLSGRRVGVFAAGKAALAMARGVPRGVAEEALVVIPQNAPAEGPLPNRTLRAVHPFPDRSSLDAARAALDFFGRFAQGDMILALISGGASSLLCLPRKGLPLEGKRRRILAAQRAGWPIGRLNALRASLSGVKGGRLADATRAQVVTLVLSDVPGADFRCVGSGPTVSARKRGDRVHLLADNSTGLRAAVCRVRELGLAARCERRTLRGEASEAGLRFARRLAELSRSGPEVTAVLLAGGETTVTLVGETGIGGRCQEFALAAAGPLAGHGGLAILAAGSDGIDGNSACAGAFVDGSTLERARERGLDAASFLARHDSAAFFEKLGQAWRPGATGTNVADWVLGLARPAPARARSEGRR